MADKFMNIMDVEKGKRLTYFKDYYLLPLIIILIIIGIVVSIVKVIFFSPRPDSYVFIATTDKYISEEAIDEMEKILNNNISDTDGDGETMLDFQTFMVSNDISNTNPEQMEALSGKFAAVLTIGTYIIEIVDDSSFNYLLEEDMVADYSVLEQYGYSVPKEKEGYIKIPLSETKFANIKGLEAYRDSIYITLRNPVRESDKTPEGIDAYKQQLKVFMKLIN